MDEHIQPENTSQGNALGSDLLRNELGEVRRALQILCEPGQVAELRAFKPYVVAGFFDDLEALGNAAAAIADAEGIYLTLNPVNPNLLSRSPNRIQPAKIGEQTSDKDIIRRRWLPIDADPKRKASSSATDAEHEAALERVRAIRDWLKDEWGVQTVLADSGNGGHVLIPVDLPADDGGLVERVLLAIAARFDDEVVKIDLAVHNPSRIWKLYGTVARKGDHTPEQPHRLARLLEVRDDLTPVLRETLEKIAGSAPPSSRIIGDGENPLWEKALGIVGRGEQNNALISLAGKMARDLSDDLWPTILPALRDRARAWPQDPTDLWTERDLEAIFKSACKMERERRAMNSSRPWRIPPGDTSFVGYDTDDVGDLTDRVVPRQRWLVSGLVAEGSITLLLGKPKKGKSTLASQIALDATGLLPMWPASPQDMVDQVPADEKAVAEVVICSMEEKKDNLASRVKAQFDGRPVPRGRIHRVKQGSVRLLDLLDWLDDFMAEHPNLRLVILDPWGLVLHEDKETNPYSREYNKIHPLRQFIEKHPQVAFQLNHHARKAAADEITDASLSTSGLPGAVDISIWLQRERQELSATVEVDLRVGAARPKIEIKFDETTLRWKCVGLAHEVAKLRKISRVFEFLEQHPGDRFQTIEFVDWLSTVEDREIQTRTAQRMLRQSGLVEFTRERLPDERGVSGHWKRINWLGQPPA